jgi:3D (Asp-Asp-Asp) domain-containing protein
VVRQRQLARVAVKAVAVLGVLSLTVGSAILAKEAQHAPPLLRIQESPDPGLIAPLTVEERGRILAARQNLQGQVSPASQTRVEVTRSSPEDAPEACRDSQARAQWGALVDDPSVRWFGGRPVRPIRTMEMTVTAYSPDERSCGDSADGITATLHPVTTNGFRLVAADPRVLPMGSMITVPGYDNGQIVPVLDVGGAIKGRRLDVLFPTHEQAREWGVRRVRVVVWGYADGLPAVSPRKLRW